MLQLVLKCCSSSIVCLCRNPPGFGFLVYKYSYDAEAAVRKLHGRLSFLLSVLMLFARAVQYSIHCVLFVEHLPHTVVWL